MSIEHDQVIDPAAPLSPQPGQEPEPGAAPAAGSDLVPPSPQAHPKAQQAHRPQQEHGDGLDAAGELTAETEAQIDAALAASRPAPSAPRAQGRAPGQGSAQRTGSMGNSAGSGMSGSGMGGSAANPAAPAKPKLRGPRVVEGGREHRTGVVVSVGPTDLFVEFGPKELGVVERLQFLDKASGQERGLPKVGEMLEVVVQRFEPSENIFVCALPGAVQKADWEMLSPGQVVEARVTAVNKGGLDLEVAGHRAFMPAGQVDLGHVKDLSVFVGEKMTCRVQRLDRRGKGNIVLSRRDLLAEERSRLAQALRETLKEGDTVEGTVRKIMDFGAFVDLGGVDGLIHIGDLAHDRINHGAKHVARHVSEGQKVRVQILKLDWEADRISLGLKQLQADPFAAIAEEVKDGAELTGKVTKILEFGAFVEVAPGIEGLVHISELDHRRVQTVEEVIKPDEVVRVKVLRVDPDTRKISLSLKALKEPPAPPKGAPGRSGGPGGGGGKPGRGDRDTRTPEEILKETPKLRRMREEAKKKAGTQSKRGGVGGLGDSEVYGTGLGDLRL